MRINKTKTTTAILLCVLSGCVNSGTTVGGPGSGGGSAANPSPDDQGSYRVFPGEFDRVLLLTRLAVLEDGFEIRGEYEADENTQVIIADKFPTVLDFGWLIRVQVERPATPSDEGPETIVRVFTRQRLATNLEVDADQSEGIFRRISASLQIP